MAWASVPECPLAAVAACGSLVLVQLLAFEADPVALVLSSALSAAGTMVTPQRGQIGEQSSSSTP